MKNLKFWILFLIFDFCIFNFSHAAPCYGTKMPGKNKFFAGLQNYSIYKRSLKDDNGKLRSLQDFVTVSYGVFDWLSIDLKGGAGDIKQHPENSGEIRYNAGFSGGYGFRVRFLDKNKMKAVFGFQHISVHPSSRNLAGVKNQAILDDWQASLFASYEFNFATPYIGTRWSRVDYIHKVNGDRKRVMSDLDKSVGLIVGIDVPLNKKIWLNLEGSFFDSSALACGLNYAF